MTRPEDSEETPIRTVRVPDDLWARAKAKAASENVGISHVIRCMLNRYARD